jgi:hypothetical protein
MENNTLTSAIEEIAAMTNRELLAAAIVHKFRATPEKAMDLRKQIIDLGSCGLCDACPWDETAKRHNPTACINFHRKDHVVAYVTVDGRFYEAQRGYVTREEILEDIYSGLFAQQNPTAAYNNVPTP